jgi:flagella basal body P-ring formation protein FlgA
MPATGLAFESHEQIRTTVEAFILESTDASAAEFRVEVNRLDPGLRLPSCSNALETSFPGGGKNRGNTTVGVRCSRTKPWLIYVPVRISTYQKVLVTTRPVSRDDLSLEMREVSRFNGGYFASIDSAMGKVAAETLNAGVILGNRSVKAHKVIQRGDRARISAATGNIAVQISGLAMTDGAPGERIRIRNLNSKRTVEGTVLADGSVKISL